MVQGSFSPTASKFNFNEIGNLDKFISEMSMQNFSLRNERFGPPENYEQRLNKYLKRICAFTVKFFYLRVFVNRTIRLEKIQFFGFDMDYTLAGII